MAKKLSEVAHLFTDAELQKLLSSMPLEATALIESRRAAVDRAYNEAVDAKVNAAFNKAVTGLDIEALEHDLTHKEEAIFVWQPEELARKNIVDLAQHCFNVGQEKGYEAGLRAGLRAAGIEIGSGITGKKAIVKKRGGASRSRKDAPNRTKGSNKKRKLVSGSSSSDSDVELEDAVADEGGDDGDDAETDGDGGYLDRGQGDGDDEEEDNFGEAGGDNEGGGVDEEAALHI